MGKEKGNVSCPDDWQVEEDMRTLCRAEEIRKDPKRLEKAQALAARKMLEMGSIAAAKK